MLKCITRNEQLRKFNIRFTNKAKPRHVSVKKIQKQHQIDLVDMKSMKVEYKGKCYWYIFSLMVIFSLFRWLAPLTTKKSSHVKNELQCIYKKHGWPECRQSHNGGEFKHRVQDYCKSRKIKMINFRPYNPKAQGKVERSHRSLRQKIYYSLIQHKKQTSIGLRAYSTIWNAWTTKKKKNYVGNLRVKFIMGENQTSC